MANFRNRFQTGPRTMPRLPDERSWPTFGIGSKLDRERCALASLFGVTLENYFVTYVPPGERGYMVMDTNPILNLPNDLSYLANQVATISAHDSCIINPPPGTPGVSYTPLVRFPDGATAFDYATGTTINFPDFPSHGLSQYFSIFVPYGAGKVIVVGNSGMVGDYGSPIQLQG